MLTNTIWTGSIATCDGENSDVFPAASVAVAVADVVALNRSATGMEEDAGVIAGDHVAGGRRIATNHKRRKVLELNKDARTRVGNRCVSGRIGADQVALHTDLTASAAAADVRPYAFPEITLPAPTVVPPISPLRPPPRMPSTLGITAVPSGGVMDNFTFGINWYANPFCKVVFNYIHSWRQSPTSPPNPGGFPLVAVPNNANAFALRAQVEL